MSSQNIWKKLPTYVQKIVLQFKELLFAWMWAEVRETYFEKRNRDHWLVNLEKHFDLKPLEAGCGGFHQSSGRGSSSIHSIPKLVRGLLVKYLYNLSYRQTEEKVNQDLLVKLWVGYGALEASFDHSTLQRFETWVLSHQERLFFDETLSQIRGTFQDKPPNLQYADTFALLGRATELTLIDLLRALAQQVLSNLKRDVPSAYNQVVKEVEVSVLCPTEEEKPSRLLTQAEREARLQLVGEKVLALHGVVNQVVGDDLVLWPEVQTWQERLGKTITDRLLVKQLNSPEGQALSITELSLKKASNYPILSTVDPDMTIRFHGSKKKAEPQLGYNASVLTDASYVYETQVDTGSRPDNLALPEMLQTQAEHLDFFPEKVAVDTIYGFGKTRATVERISNHHTQIVAKVPSYDKQSDLFRPTDFTPNFDNSDKPTLTCPNGVTSSSAYRHKSGDGVTFRFTAKMCAQCPLWDKCRPAEVKPNAHRTVFISDYRHHLEQARLYNQTDQAKAELKSRSVVERIIYNLTNLHDARQAKSYGLTKANFQVRMAATMFNIRQFLRQQAALQKAKRLLFEPVAEEALPA